MKKLLPIIILLVIFTVGTIALALTPSGSFFQSLPFLNQLYNNTKLTINTPKSKAKIVINGKEYGETNQVITDLPEGTYTVKLSRIVGTQTTSFYDDMTFIVELLNEKETIIDVEIGPAGQASGYVTYYSKSPTASPLLSVKSNPDGANIFLDNDFISKADFSARKLKAAGYKLKANADGHEELEIPVIIKDGYNLNVQIYLLAIPVDIPAEQ